MVEIRNCLRKAEYRLPKGMGFWIGDFEEWCRSQVKVPVLFHGARYRLEEDGGASNSPYFLREEEADEDSGEGKVSLSLQHPDLGTCIRLDFDGNGGLYRMTCWDCCMQFSLWDWRGWETEPAEIRWLVEKGGAWNLEEVKPAVWLDLYYGKDCSSDSDSGIAWVEDGEEEE